jgi:hypothetical protein
MLNFRSKSCLAILCGLMLSVAIGAQQTSGGGSSQPSQQPSQPSSPSTGSDANSPGSTTGAPKQPPCWQQAGISKQVMEQRKDLEQQAKSQIATVCADTSLTAQQRREKIKAIRQQTMQQVQALITTQQQEALKSCQVARKEAQTENGGGPNPSAGKGPCGDMPAASGQPSAGTGSQPKN